MAIMFTKIYKALKAFGLIGSIVERGSIGVPILALKDGHVVDGHTRLRIAKKLGLEKVPVVFVGEKIEEVDPNDLIESY